MKEVRIHARAGQGAITTAAILGEALFLEKKFVYVFPHFGAARMGAPMNAFLRFDEKLVRMRSQVYNPDYVIIVDATLINAEDCLKGLKDSGIVVTNEKEGIDIPGHKGSQKVFSLPATKIAQETIGRPLGNTAILGAFAKATGEISLESLLEAVKRRFKVKPSIIEKNQEAIRKGYEYIKI